MEFLLLTFYCNFGLAEENRSLYQGLRYVPEKPLWGGNNKVCMYVCICMFHCNTKFLALS